MNIKPITKCRICGSKDLYPVINLGKQMLATITVTEENKNDYLKDLIPLEVVRCNSDINGFAAASINGAGCVICVIVSAIMLLYSPVFSLYHTFFEHLYPCLHHRQL